MSEVHIVGISLTIRFSVSDLGTMSSVLSNFLSIGTILTGLVYFIEKTHQTATSIERMREYLNEEDQEDKLHVPVEDKEIPRKWPNWGVIEFQNVSIRYNMSTDLVLRSLSFKTKRFEKIAVVGRTGSGKSTTLLALMRILEQECSANLGDSKIIIDGINIRKIGLQTLRHNLAIIPQDAFLFGGTLRENIDPLNEHCDMEIYTILGKVRLLESLGILKDEDFEDYESTKKTEIDKILNYKIDTKGDNLSTGQKQLLVIARALVKRPSILLMDEATANIDSKTDKFITQLLREELIACTVITIAHRIATVIEYDRILVLDQGILAEQGSPEELLLKTTGIFRSLVECNGKDFYDEMMKIAQKKKPAYEITERASLAERF